jgi:cyclopropane-fatty-acyl-phospholipid synthase
MKKYKAMVTSILSPAGININGNQPHDVIVHDERFYQRLIRDGSLGAGEAYMEGWWDCADLQELFDRLMKAGIEKQIRQHLLKYLLYGLKAKLFNQQSRSKSKRVIEHHYDLGNHLYELMLDQYMVYTCGYWKDAKNLDQAQQHKLDLICRKLKLKPGLKVLDIGCGWGGFARYAAENYQVKVTGITLSEAQAALAIERCAGLDVTIKLMDYRDLNENFDRIVSIGMFEAVGNKNFRRFMEICSKCLVSNGLFLLHTIGGNTGRKHYTDPWIDKYIFPGGVIPGAAQITESFEQIFHLEDWHNFGYDYETTLQAWLANFRNHISEFEAQLGVTGRRMWEYYLSSCAAAFSSRSLGLWQLVFTHPTNLNKYISER